MAKVVRGGIDPGFKGYICVFVDGSLDIKIPIPVIGNGKNQEYDNNAISDFFEKICDKYEDIFFCLEKPHPDPVWGAKTNWELGGCINLFKQAFADWKIPYEAVDPKVWQKEMWSGVAVKKKPSSTGKTMITDTKATSEVAAKRLFPKEDFYITSKGNKSKNANDNFVDATLIAEYCRRKIK